MNSFLSIIPPILVIILALTCKNIIVALISGLQSNGSVLVSMVLLGIMLQFVKRAGGYKAFGQWCHKKMNTEKQTRVAIFWASLALSINGYLANLCVPRVMKSAAVHNKMPVEKIPLITISTVSSFSSLLPFTMFILFFSGLIVSAVEGYDGYALYIQAIPFQFFGIVSLLMALLYAYGVIPDIGPLKKLTKQAKEQVVVQDERNVSLEMLGGDDVIPDIKALIVPLGALILAIPLFSFIKGSIVVTAGILVGCIVAVLYALFTRRVKFSETSSLFTAGFKDMSGIFLILMFAFAFGQVVTQLQFSTYVINLLGSNFSAQFIPLITFLMCCLISYTTGSLSAAAIIVFPLGLPLALATGASIPLTIGACISGSHFGDLFSPISDNVIMPSEACDVSPIQASKVLTPYRLIQLAICAVLYLAFGFIL